jgi:hypothetical protein
MAELENCDLLVIDDFGSEFKSDYVRDQIVMPLLNERAKNNRPDLLRERLYPRRDPDALLAVTKPRRSTPRAGESHPEPHRQSQPVVVEKGFETHLKKLIVQRNA